MLVKSLLAGTLITTMTLGGAACAFGVLGMAAALTQWVATAAPGNAPLGVLARDLRP
jgi:hypothetical protein